MEGIVMKFLSHMDLNKDGKPDLEQAHQIVDKYTPFVKKVSPFVLAFLQHGGATAIKFALSPFLDKQGKEAMEKIEEVLKEAVAA